MKLEAFVLGTSGSMPLPRRHLSSILLRREGEEILFDCGEGMQVSLRAMHIRWKQLKVICISHSHADHVTGLPGLLMLSSQVERDKPLVIICPRAVRDFIEASREYLGMYLNYNLEYKILEDIEKEDFIYYNTSGKYGIKVFRGHHTRTVWGFLFIEEARQGRFFPEKAIALGVPRGPLWSQLQQGMEVDTGVRVVLPSDVLGPSRSGRKVVYVTDTRPTPNIIKAMMDADMVFCEGMFKHEHLERAKDKLHMTGKEAAHMLRAAGVRRAGLLHFSPRYSIDDIKNIEKEAKSVFNNVFCCRERQSMEIEYRD